MGYEMVEATGNMNMHQHLTIAYVLDLLRSIK